MAGKGRKSAKKNKRKLQTIRNAVATKKSKVSPSSSAKSSISGSPLLKADVRKLSIYDTIRKGPVGSAVNFQDLDILQFDLETALVNVALRTRTLTDELSQFPADHENEESTIIKVEEEPSTSQPLLLQEELVIDKPCSPLPKNENKKSLRLKSKIAKLEQKAAAVPVEVKDKKKKGRVTPAQRKYNARSKPVRRKFNAFDTSSKYWASLRNILREFEDPDLDILQGAINSRQAMNSKNSHLSEGKPYVNLWAETDLIEEKMRGSNTILRKKRTKLEPVTINILKNIKRGERLSTEASSARPQKKSLRKQLLKSLRAKKILNDHTRIEPPKNLNNLETRLRRDLEKHGILRPIPQPRGDPIAEDIKRLEAEFNIVQARNVEVLTNLMVLTEKEKTYQENSRKLFLVNENILKTYHALRLGKKGDTPLHRKKKQEAVRLLQEREVLVAKMEKIDNDHKY